MFSFLQDFYSGDFHGQLPKLMLVRYLYLVENPEQQLIELPLDTDKVLQMLCGRCAGEPRSHTSRELAVDDLVDILKEIIQPNTKIIHYLTGALRGLFFFAKLVTWNI